MRCGPLIDGLSESRVERGRRRADGYRLGLTFPQVDAEVAEHESDVEYFVVVESVGSSADGSSEFDLIVVETNEGGRTSKGVNPESRHCETEEPKEEVEPLRRTDVLRRIEGNCVKDCKESA